MSYKRSFGTILILCFLLLSVSGVGTASATLQQDNHLNAQINSTIQNIEDDTIYQDQHNGGRATPSDSEGGTNQWSTDRKNIICGGGEGSEAAQLVIRFLFGVLAITGIVFAMIIYAAQKFGTIIGSDQFSDYDGVESFYKVIRMILVMYALSVVAVPLFGIDISCLMPAF